MKKSKEWIEERRQGIGGSDTAVILGVSPFKTPSELAREKLGLLPEPEVTPAMQRGTTLEPIAAKLYADMTGRKLQRKTQTLTHPQYPWMIGHIDRLVVGDSRGPGILEIKCPGIKVFSQCKREGLPAHYSAQLAHYLAVTARKWGSFAVFSAERWEMIWFDVNRDDGLIQEIITNDLEFWNLLQQGIIPEDKDQPVIDMPPVGASEIIKLDDTYTLKAIEELREARDLKKQAEQLESDASAEIMDIMDKHKASILEAGNARIYFTEQNGRKTIDQKRLEQDHPEIYRQYIKIGKSFRTFKPYFSREKSYE